MSDFTPSHWVFKDLATVPLGPGCFITGYKMKIITNKITDRCLVNVLKSSSTSYSTQQYIIQHTALWLCNISTYLELQYIVVLVLKPVPLHCHVINFGIVLMKN